MMTGGSKLRGFWWFHQVFPAHPTPSHAMPPSGFSGSSSFTRFTRLVTLAASLTSPQVPPGLLRIPCREPHEGPAVHLDVISKILSTFWASF